MNERLNADLKHEINCKMPVRTKAKLREVVSNYMSKLDQNPTRVRAYFDDPRDTYAV